MLGFRTLALPIVVSPCFDVWARFYELEQFSFYVDGVQFILAQDSVF